MIPARFVRLLATALCLPALGGCGDGNLEPPEAKGPGVYGRAVLVDDTGRADRADGGGGLVVVPASGAAELWSRTDLGEAPDDLAHTGFRVDATVLEGLGATVVPVADDGTFVIATTGPALVCRLPRTLDDGFTNGCASMELPESGTLEISSGEAGLRVTVSQR